MRRYTQFGLKGYFLAVTVLALATYYWTTIPQRTTVAFADAVVSQNDDAVSSLSGNSVFLSSELRAGDSDAVSYRIKFKQRSLGDVFVGCQSAELSFLDADGRTVHTVVSEVIRFQVENAWETPKVFSIHIA